MTKRVMMMKTMLFAVQVAALSFARAFCLHLSLDFSMMMMITTMMMMTIKMMMMSVMMMMVILMIVNGIRILLGFGCGCPLMKAQTCFCQLHFNCHCLTVVTVDPSCSLLESLSSTPPTKSPSAGHSSSSFSVH